MTIEDTKNPSQKAIIIGLAHLLTLAPRKSKKYKQVANNQSDEMNNKPLGFDLYPSKYFTTGSSK